MQEILYRLSLSKFRNSFHLNTNMKSYVREKGINIINEHTLDIINKRLKEAYPKNDGKQTPMRQVHPVFIAQHACACCCRGCLEKWHKIPRGRELTEKEINYIKDLIIAWINKELM